MTTIRGDAWDFLGDLKLHVVKIDHEHGDVEFKQGTLQSDIDQINAILTGLPASPTAQQFAALAELKEMEREALMPRVTREFLIAATLMQAAQLGISQASMLDPLDPAFSPGFAKMWAFNQKTIELRKKL